MAITPLITVIEADSFLSESALWLSLTDTTKETHIYNASVHMRLAWDCTAALVNWNDPTTLDSDLKKACAMYAHADSIGVLFDPMEKEDKHGKKITETRKIAGMEKTTQWSMFGGITNGNPLDSVDAIMSVYCTSIRNLDKVVRV